MTPMAALTASTRSPQAAAAILPCVVACKNWQILGTSLSFFGAVVWSGSQPVAFCLQTQLPWILECVWCSRLIVQNTNDHLYRASRAHPSANDLQVKDGHPQKNGGFLPLTDMIHQTNIPLGPPEQSPKLCSWYHKGSSQTRQWNQDLDGGRSAPKWLFPFCSGWKKHPLSAFGCSQPARKKPSQVTEHSHELSMSQYFGVYWCGGKPLEWLDSTKKSTYHQWPKYQKNQLNQQQHWWLFHVII